MPPHIPKYHLERVVLSSKKLNRIVESEVMLPVHYFQNQTQYPFLLLNDGQDNKFMKIRSVVEKLSIEQKIEDIIVIGVLAGDRMFEYGVSAQADYKNRGSKAKAYEEFVVEELIPHIAHHYRINTKHPRNAFAGYSLGGLSAFDIAFRHSEYFHQIGVFSGSFWWRSKDFSDKEPDSHRIMHEQIAKSKFVPNMRFWFQCGTHDETDDRNKNGIIDSIDDTLDMIVELTKIGYRPYHHITYFEVENGIHHSRTWAQVMPEFLKWAFKL